MAGAPEWPQNEDEFKEWFWQEQNGDILIEKLNLWAVKNNRDDRIRRVKEKPHIYAIVFNSKNPVRDSSEEWKYVKIGSTHKDIKTKTNNGIEQVKKEIVRNTGEENVQVLFANPIGAVDTTPAETKERIRLKIGTKVDNDKAKDLNLPIHTEWVFTTQRHLDRIGAAAGGVDSGMDIIDIFKNIQQPPEVPENLLRHIRKQ